MKKLIDLLAEEIKEAFEKTNELKPKVELLEAIANIMNL